MEDGQNYILKKWEKLSFLINFRFLLETHNISKRMTSKTVWRSQTNRSQQLEYTMLYKNNIHHTIIICMTTFQCHDKMHKTKSHEAFTAVDAPNNNICYLVTG